MQIRFGLLGESAKHVSGRIGDVGKRRRLKRVGDAIRQPNTLDQANAETAKHNGTYAIGIRQGQESGDAGPHRIAHDIGAGQREMIEQSPHVVRHDRAVIGCRVIQFGRCAMAAIVERNHTASGARQGRHPARRGPVHFFV